ncbi:hypothetical protein Hanom_Chr10g00943681 [Helianthus anomalus]
MLQTPIINLIILINFFNNRIRMRKLRFCGGKLRHRRRALERRRRWRRRSFKQRRWLRWRRRENCRRGNRVDR